jgi:hypothetical protein
MCTKSTRSYKLIHIKNRDSSVSIMAKLRTGLPGFDSRKGQVLFLITIALRLGLRPNQPPIQWVAGALSSEVKRPRREADHSPPSSTEIKNA